MPLSMSRAPWEYWKHTHLTVGVVPAGQRVLGRAPEGARFLICLRLMSEDELNVGDLC
jgi:uncharacterized protein (DUF779 family)